MAPVTEYGGCIDLPRGLNSFEHHVAREVAASLALQYKMHGDASRRSECWASVWKVAAVANDALALSSSTVDVAPRENEKHSLLPVMENLVSIGKELSVCSKAAYHDWQSARVSFQCKSQGLNGLLTTHWMLEYAEPVPVVCTNDPLAIDVWLSENKSHVYGFDSEFALTGEPTLPPGPVHHASFSTVGAPQQHCDAKGRVVAYMPHEFRATVLVQIATLKSVLVVQLQYLRFVPPGFFEMLEDPAVTLAGFSVAHDVENLRETLSRRFDLFVNIRGAFEIPEANGVNETLYEAAYREFQLPLTYRMCRYGLAKSHHKKHHRALHGDGDQVPFSVYDLMLKQEQVHYLAMDAWLPALLCEIRNLVPRT